MLHYLQNLIVFCVVGNIINLKLLKKFGMLKNVANFTRFSKT